MLVEQATPVAFDDWVRARSAALQRFAYLITGDAAEAPDLVQEALAQAWPRWSSLASRGTAEAYVRRSIVNASISRWRSAGRHLVALDPERFGGGVVPGADSGVDDADAAWRLCATLPPSQRAAVVLRFYEDLAFAEIAVVLDCAEATARSHVHRALRSLRTRLGEMSDD
ncbi:SigE family RNA polymerase sigma factor [Nocardioides dubius]|uniref:SigE family RNA polymerase sigma factor n=1 Tax=Nocardioides dubius TaxID=317019 RepID=A0ABP4ELC3_9ACTN